MIFTRDHIEKIMFGQKTQTRRLFRADKPIEFNEDGTVSRYGKYRVGMIETLQPGRGVPAPWWKMSDQKQIWVWNAEDYASRKANGGRWSNPYSNILIETTNWRKYMEWGGWRPSQIHIKRMWVDTNVRSIYLADAIAEGYTSSSDYLAHAWCPLNDRSFNVDEFGVLPGLTNSAEDFLKNEAFWMSLIERPKERYTAIATEFEFVKEQS